MILLNTIKESLNLITGCGSGLGRATLLRLLKNGSGPILGIDRSFEPNFKDNLQITQQEKELLTLEVFDTFDPKIESCISDFSKKHGTIDNLINVAGVALAFALSSSKGFSEEHARQLSEFNTVGTFNVIRLATKYMIDKGSNRQNKTRCIINTSCISTTNPSMGQSFYAASKAAIDSMTICIARELSPCNIRCNTINVGYFDTRLLRSSDEKVTRYIAAEATMCPNKLGDPNEFAHLVQVIIENQMLNGACIKIDGAALNVN